MIARARLAAVYVAVLLYSVSLPLRPTETHAESVLPDPAFAISVRDHLGQPVSKVHAFVERPAPPIVGAESRLLGYGMTDASGWVTITLEGERAMATSDMWFSASITHRPVEYMVEIWYADPVNPDFAWDYVGSSTYTYADLDALAEANPLFDMDGVMELADDLEDPRVKRFEFTLEESPSSAAGISGASDSVIDKSPAGTAGAERRRDRPHAASYQYL